MIPDGGAGESMTGLSVNISELQMGLSSLMVHKLRSLLTMMGMIFGVGAVVAMLSITAGARDDDQLHRPAGRQ